MSAKPAAVSDAPLSGTPSVPKPPMTAPQPASAGALHRGSRASWRFYVCAALLAGCATAFVGLAQRFHGLFQKQPVPLKRPIPLMDAGRLAPEFEPHPLQAPPLPEETRSELGTKEFLNWRIVDPGKTREDPTCVAHVSITYYTGKPDMVPHLPDECMSAAGGRMLSADNVTLNVPGVGAPDDRVPVRVTNWEMPPPPGLAFLESPPTLRTVAYLFHCNNKFMISRTEVRMAQSKPFDRFAYYAKIDVNFTDHAFRRDANQEQTLAALPKVLAKVMGILLSDHFADWDQLNGAAASAAAPR